MTEIGIMIEGQEDLTWARFLRLAEVVETEGFDFLFRSDHLMPLSSSERRETLALWPSLTALALRTSRIRFGPLVCPMTFRQPAMVAKMAASVSVLSHGRLDLGLGAGWNAGEHQMFGIPYPRYSKRLQRLAEGTEVIRALMSGERATYEGEYYKLNQAVTFPLPQTLPIIMGGKGVETLKIVARLADEWNCSYESVDVFRAKSRELDENCEAIGRNPATCVRSLMIPVVIGESDTAVQDRIDAHRRMFPGLPATLADWLAAGFIGGSPEQVVEQMAVFQGAGVTRFMCQHNDLDDIHSLHLLAAEVLPHFQERDRI